MSRIGVTGASGYIGRALLDRLEADGHQVTTLGRRAVGARENRHAELGARVEPGLLQGLDAVVHLAANTGADPMLPPQAEIDFASALAAQAQAARCRMVFVSSQAAAPDAPSDYGRTKAAIEALLQSAQAGVSVRPGMVYGREAAGLYGVLEGIVRKLPVLPALVAPTPQVQPVHVDDLAIALARLCEPVAGIGPVVAVAGEPIGFTTFLRAIARHRVRRPRLYLPTPVFLLHLLLSLGSRLAGPKLSPARLDSLTRLPRLDARADLQALGLSLRTLEAGLSPAGRSRRALLLEADLLARATLGRRATPALARRYARALQSLDCPEALARPWWVGASLLSAFDSRGSRLGMRVGGLAWRIAVLTRLAETEPRLADVFLRAGMPMRRIAAIAGFVRAGLLETRSRLLRPLLWLWPEAKA